MARTAGILVVLVLLLPVAAAQAPDAQLPPTDSYASTLAAAAASAREGLAASASAVGGAAASAGSALADLASSIGAVATATLAAIAAAASEVASAFALFGRSSLGFMAKHPKETAIVASSTGGAITLFALLKRFGALLFLPLYTRLAPSQMLDNKARNGVYEHIRANPGAHPSAIAEALGLGWGTTLYHLGRLEGSKLVASRMAHNRKCYFAVGSDLNAEERTAVAAMAHDKAKLIVQAIRETPGISQKLVAQRIGMSQALASWHVKRLVESGVIHSERVGRSHALNVAAHVPVSAPRAEPVAVAVAA
ncbi:MAG: winged helix-turn-helix transcriptional regulator [Candidatus Thermoplasmatota archaeon]